MPGRVLAVRDATSYGDMRPAVGLHGTSREVVRARGCQEAEGRGRGVCCCLRRMRCVGGVGVYVIRREPWSRGAPPPALLGRPRKTDLDERRHVTRAEWRGPWRKIVYCIASSNRPPNVKRHEDRENKTNETHTVAPNDARTEVSHWTPFTCRRTPKPKPSTCSPRL